MVLLQKPRRSFHKGENHVKFYPINVLGISGCPVSFGHFVHPRMEDLNQSVGAMAYHPVLFENSVYPQTWVVSANATSQRLAGWLFVTESLVRGDCNINLRMPAGYAKSLPIFLRGIEPFFNICERTCDDGS